jgi:hypothetical protein
MQKIAWTMDGLLENHLESCGLVGHLDDRRSNTSYLEIRLQYIQQVGGKRTKPKRWDGSIYGFVSIRATCFNRCNHLAACNFDGGCRR